MIRPDIPIEADKESTAPKSEVPKPKVKKKSIIFKNSREKYFHPKVGFLR